MDINKDTLSEIAYMSVDATGHVYPLLGYLAELKNQGYNVDFYGNVEKAGKIVEKYVDNLFYIPALAEAMTGPDPTMHGVLHKIVHGIPQIEALWDAKKKKPKLIIADQFAWYGALLGKKHNIPVIVFYSSFINFKSHDKLAEKTQKMLNAPFPENFQPLIKEIEEKYAHKFTVFQDIYANGTLNVSSLPGFWAEKAFPLKSNDVYVGPGFRDDDQSLATDFDFEAIKGKNLIYACLGTTSTDAKNFHILDSIVEALKDTEYTVLISAGQGKDEKMLAKGLPSNVIVKNFVPQFKVLEHAKLFFTHMGANSVMEALANGVPMIGFPQGADQFVDMQIAEELKVGKQLEDTSAEGIKKVVKELLECKETQENLKKYKGMMDAQVSRQTFVGAVQTLLKPIML